MWSSLSHALFKVFAKLVMTLNIKNIGPAIRIDVNASGIPLLDILLAHLTSFDGL